MRYNFSKKQVIKNSIVAFVYCLVISTFLIAIISNLYYNFVLELISAIVLSIAYAIVFSMINYVLYLKKTFEINEQGITFFIKNKAVKTLSFSSVIETDICKSLFYGNNRIVSLTTEKETIRFSINYKVYQRIRHFFPIFNDKKEETLIKLNTKYKLKTLFMQWCVIIFYFSICFLVISPMVINLLKEYSVFYKESIKLFLYSSLAIFVFLLLSYTLYFFYKFFLYSRHSLRYDGGLKLEYYRFNKQKRNNEIKNIIGIKNVKSIFSFLFNIEQVYIIWKNDRDMIQNDFVPFCLTTQDVKKLKENVFGEQEKLEKLPIKVALQSVFPFAIVSFIIVFLSILFSPWCLMLFLLVLPCIIANFITRSSYVGDKIIGLSNGFLAKNVYTFKISEIQAITKTERFFEVNAPYSTYEIYVEGYSGVFALGVYTAELEQKIIEKIKGN